MIMRFSGKEMAAILRQHVLNSWNISEDALGDIVIQISEIPAHQQVSGGPNHRVVFDVSVMTNPQDGGGPYRTAGR